MISAVLMASDAELKVEGEVTKLMTVKEQCKRSTARNAPFAALEAYENAALEAYVSQKFKGAGAKGKKSDLTCYNCKKPGHMRRDCLKRKKNLRRSPESDEGMEAKVVLTATTPNARAATAGKGATYSEEWVVDTGASRQIC
jgi:hypothetical protein